MTPQCPECENDTYFAERVEVSRSAEYGDGGLDEAKYDIHDPNIIERECRVCDAAVPVPLDGGEHVTDLHDLSTGDQILWVDQIERKQPATVLGWVGDGTVAIRGPRNGTIWMSQEDGEIKRETSMTVTRLTRVGHAPITVPDDMTERPAAEGNA